MEQLTSTAVPAPHNFIDQGNPAQTLPTSHEEAEKVRPDDYSDFGIRFHSCKN